MFEAPLVVAALCPAVITLSGTYCMSLPAFTIWLLVFIAALLSSSAELSLKSGILLVVLCIYWRNIDLLLGICSELYQPSDNMALCRANGYEVLSRHFIPKHNFENISNEPTIFICNYAQDRFENALIMFIPRALTIITSEQFKNYTGVDAIFPTIPMPASGGGFTELEKRIRKAVGEGQSILCYSQKPLFIEGQNYGKIRSGIFHIAQSIGLTITPLYIHSIKSHAGSIYKQTIELVADTPRKVKNPAQAISQVKSFFTHMNKVNDVSDVWLL
jgi:hypothetical protein